MEYRIIRTRDGHNTSTVEINLGNITKKEACVQLRDFIQSKAERNYSLCYTQQGKKWLIGENRSYSDIFLGKHPTAEYYRLDVYLYELEKI